MSMTVNTPPVGAPSANAVDETQTSGLKKETVRTDVDGAARAGTASGGSRPTLVQPKMSAAAMMIALTALNSKIAQEGIAFGEAVIEGVQEEIKKAGAKRSEQLKQHFEDMAKVSTKQKCGLFGAIAFFAKNLFQGKIKEAFTVLTDNFLNILKDVAMGALAVAMVAGAIAVTALTAGGGTGLIVGAVVAAGLIVSGMVLSDPGLQSLVLNAMPDGDLKDKIGMAMAIVGGVISFAGAVVGMIATGGMSSVAAVAAAIRLTTHVSTGISIAASIVTSLENKEQADAQADAARSGAEIDRTDALMTDLKGVIDRQQKDLKALFDAFASIVQSTRSLVLTQGQNEARAASV